MIGHGCFALTGLPGLGSWISSPPSAAPSADLRRSSAKISIFFLGNGWAGRANQIVGFASNWNHAASMLIKTNLSKENNAFRIQQPLHQRSCKARWLNASADLPPKKFSLPPAFREGCFHVAKEIRMVICLQPHGQRCSFPKT